ncbi:MAG: DUF5067 domain-containing protein, partial [Christensenellaceae bacterium]
MKKVLIITLCLLICFAFIGCTSNMNSKDDTQNEDIQFDDFEVKVLGVAKTIDTDEKPAINISYSFTNTSGETINFDNAVRETAFFEGVELQKSFEKGSDQSNNNCRTEIQDGT